MPSVYWMKKNLQPNERSCSDHFKNRVLTMGGTLEYYDRTFTMEYADTHNYGIGFEENTCSSDERQLVVNSFNGYVNTIKAKIE